MIVTFNGIEIGSFKNIFAYAHRSAPDQLNTCIWNNLYITLKYLQITAF